MSEAIGGESPRLIEVQDNLDEDIDLNSLAATFGLSPFHFHRVFKRGVGETPKGHIDRLRLEKAWLRVAVSDDSILDIALSVGFNSHETFSRAFKRAYGMTPTALRRAAKAAQKERLERNAAFRGDGCILSEVQFGSLPATPLLAIRHVADYATLDLMPFTERDPHWNALAEWAEANGAPYQRVAIGVYYDIPGLTPPETMRSDFAIPLDAEVTPDGPFRCFLFEPGDCAVIEHVGPRETIDQAYRNVADAVRRASARYAFADRPPFQIFRESDVDGGGARNRTEVYFPVTRVR